MGTFERQSGRQIVSGNKEDKEKRWEIRNIEIAGGRSGR
jgi:hypothetical protein